MSSEIYNNFMKSLENSKFNGSFIKKYPVAGERYFFKHALDIYEMQNHRLLAQRHEHRPAELSLLVHHRMYDEPRSATIAWLQNNYPAGGSQLRPVFDHILNKIKSDKLSIMLIEAEQKRASIRASSPDRAQLKQGAYTIEEIQADFEIFINNLAEGYKNGATFGKNVLLSAFKWAESLENGQPQEDAWEIIITALDDSRAAYHHLPLKFNHPYDHSCPKGVEERICDSLYAVMPRISALGEDRHEQCVSFLTEPYVHKDVEGRLLPTRSFYEAYLAASGRKIVEHIQTKTVLEQGLKENENPALYHSLFQKYQDYCQINKPREHLSPAQLLKMQKQEFHVLVKRMNLGVTDELSEELRYVFDGLLIKQEQISTDITESLISRQEVLEALRKIFIDRAHMLTILSIGNECAGARCLPMLEQIEQMADNGLLPIELLDSEPINVSAIKNYYEQYTIEVIRTHPFCKLPFINKDNLINFFSYVPKAIEYFLEENDAATIPIDFLIDSITSVLRADREFAMMNVFSQGFWNIILRRVFERQSELSEDIKIEILHWAIKHNSTDMVLLFNEIGSFAHKRDQHGVSCLDYLIYSENFSIEMVEALIAKGARLTGQDPENRFNLLEQSFTRYLANKRFGHETFILFLKNVYEEAQSEEAPSELRVLLSSFFFKKVILMREGLLPDCFRVAPKLQQQLYNFLAEQKTSASIPAFFQFERNVLKILLATDDGSFKADPAVVKKIADNLKEQYGPYHVLHNAICDEIDLQIIDALFNSVKKAHLDAADLMPLADRLKKIYKDKALSFVIQKGWPLALAQHLVSSQQSITVSESLYLFTRFHHKLYALRVICSIFLHQTFSIFKKIINFLARLFSNRRFFGTNSYCHQTERLVPNYKPRINLYNHPQATTTIEEYQNQHSPKKTTAQRLKLGQ